MKFVPNRQSLQATDETRLESVDGSRELDFVDARKQVAVGHFHFQPREMRAQAEVLADAERDVTVRLAIDSEGVGILEDLFVPIRRGIEESDRLSRLDDLVTQRVILGRGPAEMDDRRGPAHDLFDRVVQHRHVVLDAAELVLILDEREHAAGRAVPCRLVPGDRDDEAPGEDLHVVQRPALILALDEGRDQVVFGLLAPRFDQLRKIRIELDLGCLGGFPVRSCPLPGIRDPPHRAFGSSSRRASASLLPARRAANQ